MNIQRATLVLHPNHIGTQIKDSSNSEIVAEFTKSEDYNANRHMAEEWLKENGYVHLGSNEYEKAC